MKNPLTSLHEALVYQLEGLYDAEKKLEKAMPICSHKVASPALKAETTRYGEQATDKKAKLKGAFTYLGCGPFGRKNRVMHELLEDVLELCDHASPDRIRDAMVTASMRNINQLKLGDYGTAVAFAVELQLDNVADLLREVVEWEKGTSDALVKIVPVARP